MLLKNRVTATVVLLFAFAALFAGLFVANHLHSFHGTVLKEPRPVVSFELQGSDGNSFSNANFQGKWTLLFFGFTNCGYLCPNTMAELNKMYQILMNKNVYPLPQVVMISVDPERDNLEKINQFVHAFNPNFYGARGEKDSIQPLTQELGIAYAKIAMKGNETQYDVEHTGTLVLVNPRGEVQAFFTTPHNAQLLAEDYWALLTKTI